MAEIERGYNGNINLKRKGVNIEWDAEKLQEFMKCSSDPIYFAENYIQIVHVDRGLIPIEMYEYQKEIALAITNNRRVAVNTSRQAGKTTTAAAIILHYALFNEYKTVALLANKGDSAREILDRIKIAYEALPDWLKQGIIEWNKGHVEFENGCKILAGSTSSSAIRGKSISFLYIDETAFVEGWDEFFASVFPTISSGNTTKILFTSTPNGLNHFYKTCEGAKDGKNGYVYIEVPWYKVPGRDDAWKNETLMAMDHDTQKFSQEFECVSGDAKVRVKCKETGEIKSINISDLYEELSLVNDRYLVETPNGWKDFSGVRKSVSKNTITITTHTGNSLEMTEDHLVMTSFGWTTAKELVVDDRLITRDGYQLVNSIHQDKFSSKESEVYDALEVSGGSQYYTNDILSHNCNFLGSSGTLINGSKLKQLVVRTPIHEREGFSQYEAPISDNVYVIIVDVSRGKGMDYSAFQVIDVTTMPYKQVAMFRDNMITPIDYAEIIYRASKSYNEAYVLVEVNDIGEQVSSLLHYEFECETLLSTENAGRGGKRLTSGFGKNSDLGVRTTKSVKSIGCNMLKMLMEQDQLIIQDFTTINELSTFSRKANSYEAESGCHDDTVMCLVLFGWLSDQPFFREMTDINTMSRLREKTDEDLMEDILPFGFIEDGEDRETRAIIDTVEENWMRF